MATVTSYLILSGSESDVEAIPGHSLLEDVSFDDMEVIESSADQQPRVKIKHTSALEEETDYNRIAREMSASFPTSTVLVVEVEERFDQVERVQTRLYMEGKSAGEVEHGYVFNIGGG